jgi:hypothetical protein
MGKQTNNNSSSSNSGRMLARTDNQVGRCRYISVWSTMMAAAVTTTSDQSESMRKNKQAIWQWNDAVLPIH